MQLKRIKRWKASKSFKNHLQQLHCQEEIKAIKINVSFETLLDSSQIDVEFPECSRRPEHCLPPIPRCSRSDSVLTGVSPLENELHPHTAMLSILAIKWEWPSNHLSESMTVLTSQNKIHINAGRTNCHRWKQSWAFQHWNHQKQFCILNIASVNGSWRLLAPDSKSRWLDLWCI